MRVSFHSAAHRPEAYIPSHLDRKSWYYAIASLWMRGKLISSNRLLISDNHSVDTEEEAGLPQHGHMGSLLSRCTDDRRAGCVYVIT